MGKKQEPWRNRITGHGEEQPDQLLANPKNWRIHPKAQQDALAGVLSDVGWVQSVVVNKQTGFVLDGHLRVAMAISHGDKAIPVTYVDLTEAEEGEVLATLDPLSALAVADKEQLDTLLRDVQSGDAAVQQMLADLAEKSGLQYGDAPPEDPGAQIDKAAELQEKWQTATGQLWQVGDHRILCGDSTKAEDVARVMQGEKAGAVVTDPPYGINREGIENDDPEGLAKLFDGCLSVMPVTDAVVIAFQSTRLFWVWLDAVRAHGYKSERMLWMYKPPDETFPWRGWLLKSEAIHVSSIGKPGWVDVHPYAHDTYIVNEIGKEDSPARHPSIKPIVVV